MFGQEHGISRILVSKLQNHREMGHMQIAFAEGACISGQELASVCPEIRRNQA